MLAILQFIFSNPWIYAGVTLWLAFAAYFFAKTRGLVSYRIGR